MDLGDLVAAIEDQATALDLIVGPVVREHHRVKVFLSAAHPSGGTVVIETDGIELFSLYLEEFHWPQFAYDDAGQLELVGELVEQARTHLTGGSRVVQVRRRWRAERSALEVPFRGQTHVVTGPRVQRR